jgi:hypothetical protein
MRHTMHTHTNEHKAAGILSKPRTQHCSIALGSPSSYPTPDLESRRSVRFLEVISDFLTRKKADKARAKAHHHFADFEREGLFRFLDLPKELRLMVYESLTIKTEHCTYKSCVVYCPFEKLNGKVTYMFTTVTKSLPGVMILGACKLVSDEAERIIRRKLRTILNQPPKILVEACHAKELFWSRNSPLYALHEFQGALAQNPNLTFDEYLPYLKHAMKPKKRLARDGRTFPDRHYAILRNPGVRNYMHKAARQMAYFDPLPRHNPWRVRVMDIGITNLDGNLDMANDLREVFHEKCGSGAYTQALMRIRRVQHPKANNEVNLWSRLDWYYRDTSSIYLALDRRRFGPLRGRDVTRKEWEQAWQEGEDL